VELLKVRFGEGSLHNCEVMLKDLSDSKRLDQSVHGQSDKGTLDTKVEKWLDAKILSGAFWPPLAADKINMHETIKSQLDSYGQYYYLMKKPRGLQWKPTLGVVKLTLSFDDGREVQFSVSPVLANLVMHFQDKESWSLSELSDAVGMPKETVKKRMIYWVANGVCTSTDDSTDTVYTIVEKQTGPVRSQTTSFAMEEEQAGGPADDGQDQIIISYVTGMLTNFKTLPLDRIHNMLKMFVTDPPYTKNIKELAAILDKLVAAEKLEVDDGTYTIKSA